ncbi:MAG TPA: hypothetical protein VE990_11950, partial [Acidimicrobiales bacterium]|nr:hypothetical protein [Acidimicrobiales bacterium]
SPFVTSGLRLGTAAVTTAGMGEAEMAQIASMIARVLRDRADGGGDDGSGGGVRAEVREEVATLCSKFTPYPDLAGRGG